MPAAPPTTPGTITLARHGEPALSRKITLNAEGYRRWWAQYEEGGILDGQTPPDDLVEFARCAKVIFASTRRRARETAAAVVGAKVVVDHDMFIEAPLPPPRLPSFLKFDPRVWGFLARLSWWLGLSPNEDETRPQAQARAREVADHLILAATHQGDVLVLAHGFFNHMVGDELKKRGWRLVRNRGFRYWSVRSFEKR
jgi:broad specificity phosphatase PhoE